MSGSTLYDDDILLWSEQQAAAIRRLRDGRGTVPNDLDIDNVAEEIESVGRSELAAAKSFVRLILLHLVKLAAEGDADAAGHWRGELAAFHSELADRYAPSMRQRVAIDALWRDVAERLRLDPSLAGIDPVRLPSACPFDLDDIVGPAFEASALAARLRAALVEADAS